MAVQLPDELIVEILSILPAKSLLRCQLVCKSWLSLINSTKFKLMHLHNFNQLNPRYLLRRLDCNVGEELYDVHFDDEAFTFDSDTLIEFPFDKSRVNICFRIVGCCNGVVCLSDDDYATSSLHSIILWNPSIKRKLSLTVPKFYSLEIEVSYVILGFGYDKMSDDFKVVSLAYVYCPSIRPKVEIYSVKSGIWREVMFPDNLDCFFIHFYSSQMFLNGSVHWIAYDPTPGVSYYSVMIFNVTTELFGEIQLPEFFPRDFLSVSVVGESLAVIYSSNLNWDGLESGSMYMAWVLKEYKNPASWTMIYGTHYADVDIGKPLRLRNNGDMIVELQNRDIVIFNHNEGYYVFVSRDGMDGDFDYRTYVDKYQESLALLDVGDSIPNEEAMKALTMIESQAASISLEVEMAVQLHDELIVEILSFLPAKSLVRCQSVCKSWLSLINSTKFKLKHLHNFNQLNSRYLVFRRYNTKELYSVHIDDEALAMDGGTLVEVPFKGSFFSHGFRISGCCNGIVCVSDDDDGDESSFNMIVLWNPSIKRKLTLTLPSFYPIDFKESFFVLGFGYDKMSDDYKVVCLAYINSMKSRAEVYTMKTGIWREVLFPDNLCCFLIFPKWSQVFFNGSVHWIACHWRTVPPDNTIMTFDTSSELFGQIVLPDDLVKVYPDSMMISVLGESLAVTYYKCQSRGSMSSSSYKIWVMKEYKNPTSWMMIYNMHYPDIDMGHPLQLRNKADIIMESRDGNMIIHDYNPYVICIGSVSEFELDCRTCVEKYQESLVLLEVGDSLPNDERFDDYD